jgi:hypothetical protein
MTHQLESRQIPPLRYAGTEGTKIEERQAGVAKPNEIQTEYRHLG